MTVVSAAPELSLLIVNYNTWKECARALESFREPLQFRPNLLGLLAEESKTLLSAKLPNL